MLLLTIFRIAGIVASADSDTPQEYKEALGDKFELVTAFSREGAKKVYVQHRLKERGREINELLEKKAYFYVCGDAANMAREVNAVLAQILAENRGITEAKAEEIVKNMRAANQYQVSPALPTGVFDVPVSIWLFLYGHSLTRAPPPCRRMSGHRTDRHSLHRRGSATKNNRGCGLRGGVEW